MELKAATIHLHLVPLPQVRSAVFSSPGCSWPPLFPLSRWSPSQGDGPFQRATVVSFPALHCDSLRPHQRCFVVKRCCIPSGDILCRLCVYGRSDLIFGYPGFRRYRFDFDGLKACRSTPAVPCLIPMSLPHELSSRRDSSR